MDTMMSSEVREVLTKARDKHWCFRVVGEGGMIPTPQYQDGYWYLPMERPDNIICAKYRERIRLVAQIAGIQGVIVGHESPKFLCPPKTPWEAPGATKKADPLKKGRIDLPDTNIDWQAIGSVLLSGAKIMGTLLVGILYVLAMAASVFASVDPKLIVVAKDGTQIEVATWYE